MTILKRLLRERSGTTAIEYSLIGALISVAVIGSATFMGNEVVQLYDGIANDVAGAMDEGG